MSRELSRTASSSAKASKLFSRVEISVIFYKSGDPRSVSRSEVLGQKPASARALRASSRAFSAALNANTSEPKHTTAKFSERQLVRLAELKMSVGLKACDHGFGAGSEA